MIFTMHMLNFLSSEPKKANLCKLAKVTIQRERERKEVRIPDFEQLDMSESQGKSFQQRREAREEAHDNPQKQNSIMFFLFERQRSIFFSFFFFFFFKKKPLKIKNSRQLDKY